MTQTLTAPADEFPSEQASRADQTAELYRRMAGVHRDSQTTALRNEVISLNMQVAEAVARRYFSPGADNDDVQQVAYVGLIKAAHSYDVQRGTDFLAYAVPTMVGEIKKFFRDSCWAVRPPRRVQDLQREIATLRNTPRTQGSHENTAEELAELLGRTVDDVTEALSARGCYAPTSLDQRRSDGSDAALIETIASHDVELTRLETRLILSAVIKELPESDQEVLRLRFFDDWTQDRIAKLLGTSQMQVSRHLARLMGRLRSALGPTVLDP